MFEKRKQELTALLNSNPKRKILVINQDIDEAIFDKKDEDEEDD